MRKAHGFTEARQRGSHKQYRHPDGRGTTVPFHSGRDISPTLLRKIAADVHVTVEEFLTPEQAKRWTGQGPTAKSRAKYSLLAVASG